MNIDYRTIDRFPGYRFGNDGSVWSSRVKSSWVRMKGSINKKGYLSVRIFGKWHRVHRLILEAFVGPCPAGQEGCHGPDFNRTNNTIGNLRWDTPKGNNRDAVGSGRWQPHRGQNHPNAKLSDAQVDEIRELRLAGWKTKDIAERFGISSNHCSQIGTGIRRSAVTS